MAVTPPFLNFNLNEGLEDTFLAGASILQYQRVWFNSSGAVMPCTNATDIGIGQAKQPIANAAYGTVRLDAPQMFGLANTLINVGDTVYQAANYVSAVSANNAQLGVAKYGARAPDANTGNNAVPMVILQARKSA